MTSDTWKNQLRTWANQYAHEFANKPGILGVVIGGSLARGQEWRHSDLELGILVEENNKALPYFNVDAGHGVEIIQLIRPQLEKQISQVETGDLTPVVGWPIQLWKCRIVYDPQGILGRFKKQLDYKLFANVVVKKRIEELRLNIEKGLTQARNLLAQNRPAAALVNVRLVMNDAVLALHWAYGELPRSQSRTDSRLRLLCQKHSTLPFYSLYRDVFALSETNHVVKNIWPIIKNRVLEITRFWGDSARDFFIHGVDSNFKWRQNAGILTVYRLYIPIIGGAKHAILESLDDKAWAEQNRNLMDFLGLANLKNNVVSRLVEQIEKSCTLFEVGATMKQPK